MPEAQEQHLFPCESCGSELRFAPGEDALVCDNCGNRQPLDGRGSTPGATRELDFRAALARRIPEAEIEETRIVSCPNCGARFPLDSAIHATECPFCATPIVIDTGVHRQIKPRALLPFALNDNQARKAMSKWLGSLWFAPSGLAAYARKGRKMDGIYVPFWTYDADTRSSYTGARGTIYYETRTVTRNGQTYSEQVQRIRWTPTSGRVARFFDDVLVLATKSLPKRLTDALAPWDLSALEPYRPDYLAGFRAEAYTVELDEGFDEARAWMDRMIERDVRFDIGGDRQRITDIQTALTDVTFKHILLPVWLAAYKYRGRSYRLIVNGRSGTVQGERPWSGWKIAFAIIAGALIAGTIGYFLATNR